jgi:hypothetical protein
LEAQVDAAFIGNEITPQTTATVISELATDLTNERDTLRGLTGAFDSLSIGAEELAPDEAEIMVLIPRSEVRESLLGLSREFRELDRVFGCFEELATGSRPSMKVRSLASSEFGLFLMASPFAAAQIAKAVGYILDDILKVLQIQEARARMKEQGVPDEALASVDEHASERIQNQIEVYVERFMAEREADAIERDQGREHELKAELRLSMNAIANRLDHGYNIDVRVGAEDAEDGGGEAEDDESDPALQEARAVVIDISPRLKYVNRTGGMLALPEPEPSSDEPAPGRGGDAEPPDA